jgi:hypothetical protein
MVRLGVIYALAECIAKDSGLIHTDEVSDKVALL